MSRNYDNWERLLAAVLKRELFRQLCHQDSISTVYSDSGSISTIPSDSAVFFEGCNLAFDIEDWRASAGFVGKGTFGTTYKAVLEDATLIAVKRLRNVNIVEREDFEQQMEFVGNIRHENVAPLRGYYYSKDENLLLYDFYNRGSVSQLLHGKGRRSRLNWVNWESRVKIAAGAAPGIAHIHAQSDVHGNIKSSNIFVNSRGDGCVSESGLVGLMKKKSEGEKGDVYSFGLLLLELVTGKSPIDEWSVYRLRIFEPSQGDCFYHKKLLVHELDMREYYDRERFSFVDVYIDISVENVLQELKNMLQVAKSCLAVLPEERPSMSEVVSMLDNTWKNVDLRRMNKQDGFSGRR